MTGGDGVAGALLCSVLQVWTGNPVEPVGCLQCPWSPTPHQRFLNRSVWTRSTSHWRRAFSQYSFSLHPPNSPHESLNDHRLSSRSYLQVHQVDLDNLSRQMKESKRNSRLVRAWYLWQTQCPGCHDDVGAISPQGFLYEVDKVSSLFRSGSVDRRSSCGWLVVSSSDSKWRWRRGTSEGWSFISVR